MPVRIPFHEHGPCQVALIAVSGQQNRVYHYSKTEKSWVLRDYLTGQILRSGDSGSTASDLELMVTWAEATSYRPVSHLPSWRRHCRAASQRCYGQGNVDNSASNNDSLGTWRRMNKRGS